MPRGVTSYDITWHDMTCHDMTWHDMISHDIRRLCDVLWCDVMWCDVMWCEVMWCDVMWCEVMRCDAMWCDLIWSDLKAFHNTPELSFSGTIHIRQHVPHHTALCAFNSTCPHLISFMGISIALLQECHTPNSLHLPVLVRILFIEHRHHSYLHQYYWYCI